MLRLPPWSSVRRLLFTAIVVIAAAALPRGLAAQGNGPPTPPGSGGGGGGGGGGMMAAGGDCDLDCPVYAVRVTPDGQAATAAPNTGGNGVVFTVLNQSTASASFNFTCSSTGGVTCGTVTPGALAMPMQSDDVVSVGYAVGSTPGTLTLTATGHATDAGSYTIAFPGAPTVAFTSLVGENLDRGACFTTGAGEAAGASCGDLFVVHGMPAYRTLGRDRALSLYYNSAVSTGLALVAAKVTQPAGVAQPSAVKAVLTVGSGGTLAKDSASYSGWGNASRQVVLGLGRGTVGSLPTGLYPVELAVTNVYSGSSLTSTATGELIVVNRSGSEYGQGWSLLGVEQVLLNQPVNAQGRARLLWVAGDGSARVYTETGAGTNVFQGAPGESPDSLVRYSNTTTGTYWYRRDLKHGVTVHFDETGRHRETHNRVGAVTSFHWSGATPRLDSIVVPPNDATSRRYRLFWQTTTRRLDSILDPGGRKLAAVIATGGTLSRLADPDGLATRFAYSNGRLATRVVPRKAAKGDSAVTKYTFGPTTGYPHGRLTKVEVQADSAQTQWATSTLAPWDHQGLATSQTTSQTAATITDATYGIATRVDGPISGTGDAADVWVNGYGQPTRTTHLGLNTTTTVAYTKPGLPLLPTKIIYPTDRRVTQGYDTRGNLTVMYDTIPAWSGAPALPARRMDYLYLDTDAPDSPSQVWQQVGGSNRITHYYYNSLGLTDSVKDPRGHRTVFTYETSGALKGLVRRVTERNVRTWQEVAGSANDTTDVLLDHVTKLGYDANGNPKADTSATGVITSYTFDSYGRPTHVYDPLKTHTERIYDLMNRVTDVKVDSGRVNHPGNINPLAVCVAGQSTCTDPTLGSPASWPAVNTTQYRHGWSGIDSVVDARGVKRRYRYDVRGLVRHELDEANVADTRYFSVTGLLDSTRTRLGTVVRHSYDALGRRTQTIYPARVQSPPWGGAWSQMTPGDTITYSYTALGELAVAENRYGSLTHKYHGDGSLWLVISDRGSKEDTLTYTYDAAGARTRLVHADWEAADTTVYTYNAAGDLASMVVKTGNPGATTRTFTFEWDSYGRRRQIDYPTGIVVRYRYDAAGVLRRVKATNPNTTSGDDNHELTVRNKLVDPIGRILRQTITCASDSTGSACGTHISDSLEHAYDRLGHMVFQYRAAGGRRDTMRYDASGNMIWRRRLRPGQPTNPPETYAISSGRNRIDSMTRSSGAVLSYQYNADGSRAWEHSSASPFNDRMFYYDGMGRAAGFAYYVGDVTSWHASADETRYDALGRMAVASIGSADLVYDGNNVVQSYGTGVWHFVHAPGIDNPLMGIGRSFLGAPKTLYWITDGAGRQFSVGDSAGRIPADITQQSGWGGWSDAGGTSNSQTFDAERHATSAVPGIAFFRNRVYDQTTGRWTQEDPIGLAGGLNLYQFNGNNPAAFTDPFGLCPDENDPECPDEVASVRVGPIVGLRYKAKLGVVKGEVFVGASASGGLEQEVSSVGEPDNSWTGGARLGVDFEVTAWGEGPKLHLGPRAGADAAGDRLAETPVQGDGTISVAGTIPLVWAGPVPVAGVQVEANLNIPAAYRRIREGVMNFLGGD